MTKPEDELNRRGMLVSRFLTQETIADRGISTCYPTSIINAAIAVDTISTRDAMRIHKTIIDHLRRVPELWNGSIMHIQTLDSRIADIIEQYIAIRIGYDDKNVGRLLTVPRSYQDILTDLQNDSQAHVVIVPNAAHAYAFVSSKQGRVGYVDPMDPFSEHFVQEDWFNRTFQPDNHGWVTTTPVRPRVRVIWKRTV